MPNTIKTISLTDDDKFYFALGVRHKKQEIKRRKAK